jgi:Neuraminidase (sialidase)
VFVAWDQWNADSTLRDIILKRSTDNGVTWKANSKITPGGTCTVSSGSCPVLSKLVASGSTVYMISEKAGDVFLRRSADNGVTWKTPVNLSSNSGNSFDPDIAISGANIYVTWSQANAVNTSFDILFRRSTDSGATWKSKVNLSNDSFFSQFARIAASGSTVYVVWGDAPWDGPGSSHDISLRRSIDGGASWETRKVISETEPDYDDESGNRNGAYDAQIIALGSNVYVAYKDNVLQGDKDAQADIFFRRSTDGGNSWAPSVKVGHADNNDNPDECIPFNMAVSGTNVFMVWAGSAACGSELGISFSRSTDGGVSWSAPAVLTEVVFLKGAMPSSTLEMAASGSTVFLVVTRVMSGPGFDIFVGRSTDSGQTWPLATNLSKMSGLSLNPQIGS